MVLTMQEIQKCACLAGSGRPGRYEAAKQGGGIGFASLRAAEKDEIAKSCRVHMQLGVLVRRARKELRGEEEPWRRKRRRRRSGTGTGTASRSARGGARCHLFGHRAVFQMKVD